MSPRSEDPVTTSRRRRLMVFDGVGLAFGAFGLYLPIFQISAAIR